MPPHTSSEQTAPHRRFLASILIPLLTAAMFLVLALEPELRLAVPLLVGVSAAATMLLAFVLYRGESRPYAWSPAVILGVALLLRLMFVTAPAQLSDDIYRYLWDGHNVLSGINPYAAAPAAMTPQTEMRQIHQAINHKEYTTIYPPAAQLVFAAGTALGGTVTGLKAFLVLIDLVLCAMTILLLQQLGLPIWRAVLYAWNPLPVLEIAGSGHVDGAGMALFLAAVLLLFRYGGSRTGAAGSGAVFAAAALIKLFPLVLGPVLFLLVPRPRRLHFAAGFCYGATLLSIPFLPDLVRIWDSLGAYGKNWEFSGFAFNALRSATGSGSLARLALVAVLLVCIAAATWRTAAAQAPENAQDGQVTPVKARRVLAACYAVAMALLLTTPTLQPWYALILATLLPFAAGPAGVVLCWAVLLTYRVQLPYFILGEWIESGWVTAAVFLAPVTAWGMGRLLSRSRQAGDPSVSSPAGR
ncbi:DUF2029 domain-containing protein [Geomonas terrae]|uniref:DUF2029 domain-containing protein n=1 Tax=Geomonas terrae TaxID=2562681 RepID=A0A4S1CC66_9BACT|nr:glycosyltransferase 87 family protein [Geomonas terrae]TGU70753.1 DUF2029 domain-containing protein [Geomonas terrae]